MNSIKLNLSWLLLVILLPLAGSAHAACEITTPSYEALRDLEMEGCFNDKAKNTLLAQVIAQVPAPFDFSVPNAQALRAQQIGAALALVSDSIQREQDVQTTPALAAPINTFAQKLNATTATGPGTRQDWKFEGESGLVGTTGVNVKFYVDSLCAQSLASCRSALEASMVLLRAAMAMEEIAFRSDRVSWAVFQDHYSVVRQRWHKYLFEARSQYWWELAVNAARYDAQRDRTESFPSPPDYQWILLHPDVALEYVGNAEPGSRLQPSIILEWVGYNRWSWSGANMDHPLGVSIVSSYSDRAGVKSVGYGLLFHYKNTYSLGITKRDGDTGIFMSVDLGKYLLDKQTQLNDARQHFDLRQALLNQSGN